METIGDVQMALRHDDALGQLHLAGRPNQLTGAGALHIAAFADGGVDAPVSYTHLDVYKRQAHWSFRR